MLYLIQMLFLFSKEEPNTPTYIIGSTIYIKNTENINVNQKLKVQESSPEERKNHMSSFTNPNNIRKEYKKQEKTNQNIPTFRNPYKVQEEKEQMEKEKNSKNEIKNDFGSQMDDLISDLNCEISELKERLRNMPKEEKHEKCKSEYSEKIKKKKFEEENKK